MEIIFEKMSSKGKIILYKIVTRDVDCRVVQWNQMGQETFELKIEL